MENESSEKDSVAVIRDAISAFRRSKSNLPVTAERATAKLLSKSLELDEIGRRRDAFYTHQEIDGTAVLANYELLHGVKYLNQLRNCSDQSVDAKCIVAVFRGAEICLNNIAVLARRGASDIGVFRFGRAAIKITWMNYFHETLYRFSQLLIQLDLGRENGDCLRIEESRTYESFVAAMESMHEALKSSGEQLENLAEKDIDDPQRFTFFHSFVNTNYEAIWASVLRNVRVPGVYRHEGETPAQFYQRVVQNQEVYDAVTCVDLKDVTYLMQFRAYHQISEVLVGLVNDVTGDVILTLIDEQSELSESEVTTLSMCNRLLQIVTDNIKPIVRTLSPKAYYAIRPALGITSGSHSHNLRQGLFLTIYPLLVRAVRLRLTNFKEDAAANDSEVRSCAEQLLRGERNRVLSDIVRQTVCMHQAVRTWRDEHIQFVKTQIGVSREDRAPTASISGAENAAQTAHGFRATHANDAIAPIYEAVLGRRPPPPFDIVHTGRFDEYMAFFTADAVKTMYADVQKRAQRKRSTRTGVSP